jgi:hypothetical protein
MDIEIASAAAGTRARVAGNDQHWVVVYQGTQGGIFYTELSAPGGSIGMANQQVNVVASGPQTEPDVAMLPSGDFVVVWRSGDAIMFQRYSAGGTKLNDTDQNAPLNGRSPPGATPAVAAATTDPFYVAAWATADGSVWSRLIDDTEGFRLNNVTGQNDDYQASHPGIVGQRVNPDVAVGGEGFIAYAWLDNLPEHYGIYARRFPLPRQ